MFYMQGFSPTPNKGRRWRRHVTFWMPDELWEAIEAFRLARNLDFSVAARTLITNALAMEKSKQPRSRALKSQSAGGVYISDSRSLREENKNENEPTLCEASV